MIRGESFSSNRSEGFVTVVFGSGRIEFYVGGPQPTGTKMRKIHEGNAI